MTTVWSISNFPISLDTFSPSLVDGVDFVIANHPNTLASAVVAIQGKLGRTGDPITGLGGVSFDPSGKSSNPGSGGVPTIWTDNSSGPGFILKFTDDGGSTYTLAGPGLGTLQAAFDLSTGADPSIDVGSTYLSIKSDVKAPGDYEKISYQVPVLISTTGYVDTAYNSVIYGGFFFRNNTSNLSKHRVSRGELIKSRTVTPSLGGIAVIDDLIFIANDADNTIYVYDADSLLGLNSFAYSGGGSGITVNSTHVFVSVGTPGNHGFEVYTHAGALVGSATRATANNTGGQIAVDDTYVYLCNSTLDTVEQFLLSGYSYVSLVSVTDISGVVTISDGNFLASSLSANEVYRYNSSLSLVDTYAIPTPRNISYAGTHLCVDGTDDKSRAYILFGLDKTLSVSVTKLHGKVIELKDGSMTYPVYPSDILQNIRAVKDLQSSRVKSFNTRTGDVLPLDGDYTANQVRVVDIDSSPYDAVQDWMNFVQGRGLISGGIVSEGTVTGSVDASSGDVICKVSNTDGAATGFVSFSAVTDLVLTDLAVNYIYIEYNGGSPVVSAGVDSSVLFDNSLVVLDIAYRMGSTVRLINYDPGFNDFNTVLTQRFIEVSLGKGSSIAEWAYGAALSSIGTRNLYLTAGVFYGGTSRKTSNLIDTSASDAFTYIYKDGVGGFTSITAQTQVNNQSYDDGSGSLQTLANKRYGVHWVYLCFCGSDVSVVYGEGSFTLEEAQQVDPPTSLPPNLADFSIRVGKVIIQKGSDDMIIQSPFGIAISSSSIPVHNGLSGLQGGDGPLDQFYHLTASQLDTVARSAAIISATGEATGFEPPSDPDNLTVSVDDTGRTVTVSGSEVLALEAGNDIGISSGWESALYPVSPVSTQFLYYMGGVYTWSTTPWPFTAVQICAVVYNSVGSFLFGLEETHGCRMDADTHEGLHSRLGTYRSSGGDVAGIVLQSTTAANKRPTVSVCVVADEDKKTRLPAHTTKNAYTYGYLSGAAGLSSLVRDYADITPINSGKPQYNEWTGSTWQLTDIPNNRFGVVFVHALPVTKDSTSQKARYTYIVGQQIFNALSSAQQYYPQDLNYGEFSTLIPEIVAIQRFIIKRSGGNWTIEGSDRLEGSRASTIGSVSGSFLSSVTTDKTLQNNGTSALPLGLSPDIPLELGESYAYSNSVILNNTDTSAVVNRDLHLLKTGPVTQDGFEQLAVSDDYLVCSVGSTLDNIYIIDRRTMILLWSAAAPEGPVVIRGSNAYILTPSGYYLVDLINETIDSIVTASIGTLYDADIGSDGLAYICGWDGSNPTIKTLNLDTAALVVVSTLTSGMTDRAYGISTDTVSNKVFIIDADGLTNIIREVSISAGTITRSSVAMNATDPTHSKIGYVKSIGRVYSSCTLSGGLYCVNFLNSSDLNVTLLGVATGEGRRVVFAENVVYSIDRGSFEALKYQLPSLTLISPDFEDRRRGGGLVSAEGVIDSNGNLIEVSKQDEVKVIDEVSRKSLKLGESFVFRNDEYGDDSSGVVNRDLIELESINITLSNDPHKVVALDKYLVIIEENTGGALVRLNRQTGEELQSYVGETYWGSRSIVSQYSMVYLLHNDQIHEIHLDDFENYDVITATGLSGFTSAAMRGSAISSDRTIYSLEADSNDLEVSVRGASTYTVTDYTLASVVGNLYDLILSEDEVFFYTADYDGTDVIVRKYNLSTHALVASSSAITGTYQGLVLSGSNICLLAEGIAYLFDKVDLSTIFYLGGTSFVGGAISSRDGIIYQTFDDHFKLLQQPTLTEIQPGFVDSKGGGGLYSADDVVNSDGTLLEVTKQDLIRSIEAYINNRSRRIPKKIIPLGDTVASSYTLQLEDEGHILIPEWSCPSGDTIKVPESLLLIQGFRFYVQISYDRDQLEVVYEANPTSGWVMYDDINNTEDTIQEFIISKGLITAPGLTESI